MELKIIEEEKKELVALLKGKGEKVQPVCAYLEYLDEYLSVSTIRKHGVSLRRFWQFLDSNRLQYNKITPPDIFRYKSYLQDHKKRLSNDSIGRHISHLRKFFLYAKFWEIEYGDNPNSAVNNITALFRVTPDLFAFEDRHEVEFNILSEDNIRSICSNLTNKRDKLILRLMYHTGITAKELLSLRMSDVCFTPKEHEKVIKIVDAITDKKGKRDFVMHLTLFKELKKYIETERENIDNPYVFLSLAQKEKRLTQYGIYRAFATAQEKAEVSFRLTDLRYSFIANCIKNDASLEGIENLKDALGDARSVDKYFSFGLSKEQRRKIIKDILNK